MFEFLNAVDWQSVLGFVGLAGGGAALRGVLGYYKNICKDEKCKFDFKKFTTSIINGFVAGVGLGLSGYIVPEMPTHLNTAGVVAAFSFGFMADVVNKEGFRTYFFNKLQVDSWESAIQVILGFISNNQKR